MWRVCSSLVALAASVVLVVPTSVWADGYDASSLKDAPLPAETYVWDGLHIGAGIGVGSFDHDGSLSGRDCFIKPQVIAGVCKDPYRFGDDDWDVFGTVQLGYDRVLHDRFLVGLFTDFDIYRDAESTYAVVGDGSDIKVKLELEDVWNVGGRLGVLVTPRILLYGVGGYSRADIDGTVVDDLGAKLKLSDDVDGYFIGGGGEIKLRSNLALRLEYRWTDFGSISAADGAAAAPVPLVPCIIKDCGPPDKLKGDVDHETHSVRAALVFKFGAPEPLAPAPLK